MLGSEISRRREVGRTLYEEWAKGVSAWGGTTLLWFNLPIAEQQAWIQLGTKVKI